MKGVGEASQAKVTGSPAPSRTNTKDAGFLASRSRTMTDHERYFWLSFVVVQPVLYFSFQLLALMMNRLINPGSVSAVKRDFIDRPEENNRKEEQRKGPHGAHLNWIRRLPVQ
jgi:hypothetical protein